MRSPSHAADRWDEPTQPDIRPESCGIGDVVRVMSLDGARAIHIGEVTRLRDKPIGGVVRTLAKVFGAGHLALHGEFPLTRLQVLKRKGS
jgi:hypothetical protein